QPPSADHHTYASLAQELEAALPQLFRTSGRVFGLGATNPVAVDLIASTFRTFGDSVLVIAGGPHSKQWHKQLSKRGAFVSEYVVPYGADIDVEDIAALLRDKRPSWLVAALSESNHGGRYDIK